MASAEALSNNMRRNGIGRTSILLCEPRSHPLGMLDKLVGAVENTLFLGTTVSRAQVAVGENAYLFRGQRLARKVIDTRVEALFYKVRVHFQKVLHLRRIERGFNGQRERVLPASSQ